MPRNFAACRLFYGNDKLGRNLLAPMDDVPNPLLRDRGAGKLCKASGESSLAFAQFNGFVKSIAHGQAIQQSLSESNNVSCGATQQQIP